jgi:transcriptional regulator with XRE-family HTH domain
VSAEAFRKTIAERLKTCRETRGLSLDATAAATGVSKAMLGQIERLESAPTIATLWKIATGLDISFSSFFAGGPAPAPRRSLFPDDPDMRIDVVFPYSADTGMEMFEVTLTNGHHQRSPAHGTGVVEHVVVLKGAVELSFEGTRRRVGQGEAVRFHADVEHEYRALTDPAVFQNIICYG